MNLRPGWLTHTAAGRSQVLTMGASPQATIHMTHMTWQLASAEPVIRGGGGVVRAKEGATVFHDLAPE